MDNVKELSELKQMLELELISDEEYQQAKAKILNNTVKPEVPVNTAMKKGVPVIVWFIGIVIITSVVFVSMHSWMNSNQKSSATTSAKQINLNEERKVDKDSEIRFDNLLLSRAEAITKAIAKETGIPTFRVGTQAVTKRPSTYPDDEKVYRFEMLDRPIASAGGSADARAIIYEVDLKWNDVTKGFDIANMKDLPAIFDDLEEAKSTEQTPNPVDEWVDTFDKKPFLTTAINKGFSAEELRSSQAFGDQVLSSDELLEIQEVNSITVL